VCIDNPIEALAYIIGNFCNCCIVITNYKMTQLSRIDLLKNLREFDINCIIKVILISAYIKNL